MNIENKFQALIDQPTFPRDILGELLPFLCAAVQVAICSQVSLAARSVPLLPLALVRDPISLPSRQDDWFHLFPDRKHSKLDKSSPHGKSSTTMHSCTIQIAHLPYIQAGKTRRLLNAANEYAKTR